MFWIGYCLAKCVVFDGNEGVRGYPLVRDFWSILPEAKSQKILGMGDRAQCLLFFPEYVWEIVVPVCFGVYCA